jgi:hypothetical protein
MAVTTAKARWDSAARGLTAMDQDFLSLECAAKYRDDASFLDPSNSGSILKDIYLNFFKWWAVLFRQVLPTREVRFWPGERPPKDLCQSSSIADAMAVARVADL